MSSSVATNYFTYTTIARNSFEDEILKGLAVEEETWRRDGPWSIELYTADKLADIGLEPVDTTTFIQDQKNTYVFFVPRPTDGKFVLAFVGSCGSRDGIVKINYKGTKNAAIPVEQLAYYTFFSYRYARENPCDDEPVMPWREWEDMKPFFCPDCSDCSA